MNAPDNPPRPSAGMGLRASAGSTTGAAGDGEAAYAQEWYIALAKEIVSAERAVRSGRETDFMLEHTSKMVYERFNNLEKGLMSNGVPRPERR